jgi:hypothetical protein
MLVPAKPGQWLHPSPFMSPCRLLGIYVAHTGGPCGSYRVPPGHLLLLGDNRLCSNDSRHWQRPYLPLTAVRGTVITGFRRVRDGGQRTRDP